MSKTEFKPFDRVLVREHENEIWNADIFSSIPDPNYVQGVACIGGTHRLCISYEGNEHLIGTTDAPKEKWEPKKGDIVSVSEDGMLWVIAIFCECGAVGGKLFYRARTTALSSCFSWNFCEPAEKHFPELRVKNEV